MVAFSNLINNGLLVAGQLIFGDLYTPQQASTEQYSIINFLGGPAPYIQHPGFGLSTDILAQCTIEQVHLLHKHGERFPTKNSEKRLEKVVQKFTDYNETFVGELAFLNDYTFFFTDLDNYEKETSPYNSEGTYAGITSNEKNGVQFRAKYKAHFNESSFVLNVFSTNSGRVLPNTSLVGSWATSTATTL